MKTFVLIAGIWLNVDNIASLEDSYRKPSMWNDGYPYCNIMLSNGMGLTIENESCADIVRDVTTQMEDPN